MCPICLNELDEGEDLISCDGCHNQLHQHCMDICELESSNTNRVVPRNSLFFDHLRSYISTPHKFVTSDIHVCMYEESFHYEKH